MGVESLRLYAATFVQGDTERVVLLHASDEDDAHYCLREGYGRIKEVRLTPLDLQVGVMVSVYERKIDALR